MTGRRPLTVPLLRLLSEAGSTGIAAGDLVRQFDTPDGTGPRNRLINTTLARMALSGYVRRSAATEKSVHYHGCPVYRWFIAPPGERYLLAAASRAVLLRQEREAARIRREATAAQRRAELRDALHKADAAAGCILERNAAICELRDSTSLTLASIGEIFGLTRERVRQVTAGISVSGERCRCGTCDGPVTGRTGTNRMEAPG